MGIERIRNKMVEDKRERARSSQDTPVGEVLGHDSGRHRWWTPDAMQGYIARLPGGCLRRRVRATLYVDCWDGYLASNERF